MTLDDSQRRLLEDDLQRTDAEGFGRVRWQPEPNDMPVPVMPTEEEIEAARSPHGGWTKEQMASWGVPWPPPKGWKKRLKHDGVVTHVTHSEESNRD
jgi:hypothetical protein